jgi:Amt family ammonium transporter
MKDAAGKVLPLGLVDGHGIQLLYQSIGIAIAWGLAIVGSLIALKIADMIVGVRVTQEEEQQGLDLTQHGEEGYLLEN